MMAWLLSATVLLADICGNNAFVYAAGTATLDSPVVTGDDGSLSEKPEDIFASLVQEYDMYGVLNSGTDIEIHTTPSQDADILQSLPSGYQVRLTGAVLAADGLWFQAAFAVNDVEYTGYIQSSFVVSQDTRLTEWKQQYVEGNQGNGAGINSAVSQGNTDLSAFPSSYRSYIQKLIQAHPNWTFVPMNTGLSWSEVVKNEMVNSRNLVDINHPVT